MSLLLYSTTLYATVRNLMVCMYCMYSVMCEAIAKYVHDLSCSCGLQCMYVCMLLYTYALIVSSYFCVLVKVLHVSIALSGNSLYVDPYRHCTYMHPVFIHFVCMLILCKLIY